MKSALFYLRIVVTFVSTSLLLVACRSSADEQVQARLVANAPGLQAAGSDPAAVLQSGPAGGLSGYARAEGPEQLVFPRDHGPHPDYQTEWWYYTGNLRTPQGRHFGYQLTFFRRALLPPAQRPERASNWDASQAYMAHFAITDTSGGAHRAFERLSRGSAGLAGAQAQPYQVWLNDWFVRETAPGSFELYASQDGLVLQLNLTDRKGPVLQGDAGYSQKGPEPGNASFYVSYTRLESSGEIRIDQQVYPLSGLSWMDHEYSTSALSQGQVGWDWFSIQLDDGSELMFFQLRRQDGSIDPYSSGALIAADGTARRLSRDDFSIEVLDSWRSPVTQDEYPSRWRLLVPAVGIELQLTPHLQDQELDLTYAYWEGAVSASGSRDGTPLSGDGYVELTGYASASPAP